MLTVVCGGLWRVWRVGIMAGNGWRVWAQLRSLTRCDTARGVGMSQDTTRRKLLTVAANAGYSGGHFAG